MNFKNISVLLIVCFIMGCSDFLKGQKKEDEVLKFKGDRFACLSKVPESLRNMLAEESTPDNLEETIDCLESSLTYFKRRTKGNVPDGYSVEDIRSFFGNYLGDSDRVTDTMASQMMKIKKALFGGNEQVIAKTELQALINFLVSIKAEIQPLKPYWDIVIAKDGTQPSKSRLIESHQLLKDAAIRLVLKTHVVQSDYSFVEFKEFMAEVEKFVQRAPSTSSVDFIKLIPLIESVKVHLFGKNTDMGTVAKWKEAVSQVLELHKLFTLYKYRYKGHEFYSREALTAGDDIVLTAITLLDKAWPVERGGILFSDTKKLLKALENLRYLPANLTADTGYEAYTSVVKNILDHDGSGRKKILNPQALTSKHVLALKNEYRGFKAVQNFNDSMPDAFTYPELIRALDRAKTAQVAEFSEASDELLDLSWRDWNTHLRQPHPLIYLKTGKLLLDRKAQESLDWSWVGLTRLNVMKFLNRMLMFGFGQNQDVDLNNEVLNERSFEDFYSAFWEFGVKYQAFDPRMGNSGKRTFFEADHFVYSGNGNGQVNLQESFELVNIIFSAGLSGLAQIQEDLSKSVCALKENDFYGNPWLDEACVKRIMRERFGDYFKNLTGLAKWVETMDESEWDRYFNELVEFSRVNPKNAGRLETGDLRTMVVITHYVESMYIKMDTDEDDKLSIPELIEGSKRFTPFFKTLFKLEPKGPILVETQENLIDYAVSRAFACMVITGEMPKVIKTCTPAFFKDAVWKKSYSNRTLILRTLNAFKSSIK